jgi:hypothetical protein
VDAAEKRQRVSGHYHGNPVCQSGRRRPTVTS